MYLYILKQAHKIMLQTREYEMRMLTDNDAMGMVWKRKRQKITTNTQIHINVATLALLVCVRVCANVS